MATAVGVVFSPGGKVYSFDPGGLELAWNTRVICQTSRGHELGRVVKPNHELKTEPSPPLKRVLRRATLTDEETHQTNEIEAKRAMTVFREVIRQTGADLSAFRDELRRRLARRVELRSVGPRECARLCGDHGLCGGQHCCRRFPSHEQPITLRMAKDQELPMSSGRITGLCGRLRCCLAFEHPTYKSFRDRAPRVGRLVETPRGRGLVTDYQVLEDTCTVELEDADPVEFPIGECRELSEEPV
jgi:cell fate regulator YaaT (PSP1 superfamily)